MRDEKVDPIQSCQGDLVLRGIWQAKDTLSAAYGHDLDRLFEETRAREKQSGRKVVNLSRSSAGTAKP